MAVVVLGPSRYLGASSMVHFIFTGQSRSRQHVSFRDMYGHVLYMSPEQSRESECTEKVDIYSLGVIYFEMNYIFPISHEVAYRYSLYNEIEETLFTEYNCTFCTDIRRVTGVRYTSTV